jgi:hypothetical protein
MCGSNVDDMCVQLNESNQRSKHHNKILLDRIDTHCKQLAQPLLHYHAVSQAGGVKTVLVRRRCVEHARLRPVAHRPCKWTDAAIGQNGDLLDVIALDT